MHSRTAVVLLTTAVMITTCFLCMALEPLILVMVLIVGIDMLIIVSVVFNGEFVYNILGVVITCNGMLVVVRDVLLGVLVWD